MSVLTANSVLTTRLWTVPSDRTKAIVREATLILGFALLTALAAQIKFSLGFTPVPITGQTFAVLVSGAALGMRSGAASQVLYWLMGLALPFYAGGKHGWEAGTGGTFGYLIGFVLAAAAIGYLAERRQDRNFATSLSAMALGSVIIYICGAAWLMHKYNIPLEGNDGENAMAWGVTPFLVGDLAKMIAAGAAMPLAWSAVNAAKK